MSTPNLTLLSCTHTKHQSTPNPNIEARFSDLSHNITEAHYQVSTMSTSLALNAFTHPHPWTPSAVRLYPTPSLISAQTSIAHQLYILDCRGHDARDMQRTLNYFTAELRMREVEDLALAEAIRKTVSEESKGNIEEGGERNDDIVGFKTGSWIKKKDGGARMREMEDEDKRWEKENDGNPRWAGVRQCICTESRRSR